METIGSAIRLSYLRLMRGAIAGTQDDVRTLLAAELYDEQLGNELSLALGHLDAARVRINELTDEIEEA